MAEITLRSYIKEIEGLIELERLDEAMAHCRHILQIYPKHIDSYRLLGKAYLEAKRYGDASDIFQRVLSAEPSDFVSHIGMSVIREDEGNLDIAIWHMERAFETNPANQVIQQELKRLFGVRDELEPLKIRLTRGALAHMYANGDLYPQAIAELRAALEEDPDRPDLQVLLADMHWRTNNPLKAAEVCSEILESLPHCLTANRIMAAVLQSSGKSDASTIYLRRLAALDPYTAYIESPADDVANVDDESISIEKLAWDAGQDLSEFVHRKPDWATSLGEELAVDEQVQEDAPSWQEILSTSPIAPTEEIDLQRTGPFTQELSQDDDTIPEWMRDIGWGEADGETPEEQLSFSDEELEKLERGVFKDDEIAAADIPEWLTDIAPSEAEVEIPEAQESEPSDDEDSLPSWLKGVTGELRAKDAGLEPSVSLEDEIDAALEKDEPEDSVQEIEGTEGAGQDIPSWLETPEPGASETIIGWLGKRTTLEEPTDTGEAVSEEPASDATPQEQERISWLDGIAEAAAQEQQESEKELDRLREISQSPPSSLSEDAPTESTPQEPPAWLLEISEQIDEEAPAQEMPLEATPEIETPAEEQEILPSEGVPEWVQDISPEETETEELTQEPESIRWRPEFASSKVTRPLGPITEDREEPGPEIPDQNGITRLRDLAEEITKATPPEDRPPDIPEIPEWLHEMSMDVPPEAEDDAEETLTQKLFKEVDRLTKETEPSVEEKPSIPEVTSTAEPIIPEEPREIEPTGEPEHFAAGPPLVEEPIITEAPSEAEPVVAEPPAEEEPIITEAPSEAEPVAAESPVVEEPIITETPSVAESVAAEPPAEEEPIITEAPSEAEPVAAEPPAEEEPFITEAPSEAEPVAAKSPAEEEPIITEVPSEAEPIAAEPPDEEEPIITEAPSEEESVAAEPPAEDEPIITETPSEAEPIAAELPAEEEPIITEAPPVTEPVAPVMIDETEPIEDEYPSRVPEAAPKPKFTEEDAAELLKSARSLAKAGDIQNAANAYAKLVRGRHLVPEVIESLHKVLELHPNASAFWKVLGDAHMKADRISEAVKAYQRGLKRV
ncbi:MAG: tetratricopeptide repeat protein [Anaerolineales bacterium]|jgi:tetratricopeptide (TPR) repeat protein